MKFVVLGLVVAAIVSLSCGPRESPRNFAAPAVVFGVQAVAKGASDAGRPDPQPPVPEVVPNLERTPETVTIPARKARPAAASGCGRAAPADLKSGATIARVLWSGGIPRQYRVHVPAGASNTAPIPLVLNFHGRTSSAAEQETYSGLAPLSDREKFVLVSPDGTGNPRAWSAGATKPGSTDDVRFTSDLLDAVQRDLCIDAGRVFATGFSNGAFMASRVACELADRITAVAAVGGVDFPASGVCAPGVPVLAFHGVADDVVPCAGGIVKEWKYGGAYRAMARWAANNGGNGNYVSSPLGAGVTRIDYNTRAGTSLVLVQGAGHVWPGSPVLAEAQRTSLNAAEMIWAFFSDKRM